MPNEDERLSDDQIVAGDECDLNLLKFVLQFQDLITAFDPKSPV